MTRCVIAEDERLLREALLEQLAKSWPDLEIVAICEDGGSALEAIADHQPEVAFLDIRMPGLTGLEVAAAAAEASPGTRVVFVTAYDQYAIDAFDRGVVDYLLKPVDPERLAATVERLRDRTAGASSNEVAALARLLAARPKERAPAPYLTWVTASAGRETRLVMVEDVLYFQADNKYTLALTPEGEVLLRTPVRDLLDRLDPAVFKQIHRGTIVNVRAIISITRDEAGRGLVNLRSRPEKLTISQPFMALFRAM